jgi:hypothetical protein
MSVIVVSPMAASVVLASLITVSGRVCGLCQPSEDGEELC